MATPTVVSIDDYLGSSFHLDVEYIDGELKERPVVFSMHGLPQSLTCIWFGKHEDDWRVRVAVEVRTRVSTSRVRLPDVVVDNARKWPETLVEPPLIVIEILSPNDSYAETQRLAKDYLAMGVENIWLIEPETRTGRICKESVWIETMRFQVENSPIYLDLSDIFARLDRYDTARQPAMGLRN